MPNSPWHSVCSVCVVPPVACLLNSCHTCATSDRCVQCIECHTRHSDRCFHTGQSVSLHHTCVTLSTVSQVSPHLTVTKTVSCQLLPVQPHLPVQGQTVHCACLQTSCNLRDQNLRLCGRQVRPGMALPCALLVVTSSSRARVTWREGRLLRLLPECSLHNLRIRSLLINKTISWQCCSHDMHRVEPHHHHRQDQH